MRRARDRWIAVTVVAVVALAAPATAQATFDIAVTQTESADPVAAGTPVTYTATLTNEGTETFDAVGLDLYSLTPGGSGAVPANPYRSVSQSRGQCAIFPAGEYQQVLCSLGSLAPGESAQVSAVVEAHESMDHVAGLLRCEFGPDDSCQATSDTDPSDDAAMDRLTVIVPPAISGSPKVRLKGLPAGCVAGDVVIKAKARAQNVKEIKAKLIGRRLSERLGRASGRKLTFTLPGSKLEQARFYELNVNVTRRGGPGLKRSVELQAC
jgi:hypothetical protein